MKKLTKLLRRLTILCAVIGIYSFSSGFLIAKKYVLASGFKGGTYFKIGLSLNKLSKTAFKVINTKGSIDNLQRVRSGKADFAITQLDIFENLSYFDTNLKKEVKILFLLYKEEVHILTSKKIKALSDLKLKKVGLGPKNSGTYSTSQILFAAMQMNETMFKIDNSSPQSAINNLLKGKLDAVFIVAGAPIELLTKLPASAKKKIHFLEFSNNVFSFLTEGYLPYNKSIIKKDQYIWQNKKYNTISTDSAVIVKKSMPDKVIKNLLKDVFKNRNKLIKSHPKWKEVNFKDTKKYFTKNKDSFHKAVSKSLKYIK